MKARRIIYALTIICTLVLFSGYRTAPSPLNGRIVYSNGSSRLVSLDLKSRDVSTICDVSAFITGVSRYGANRVVVSQCSADGSCLMNAVSLSDKSQRHLIPGQGAVFVEASQTLYYWSSCEDRRDVCLYRSRNAASTTPSNWDRSENLLRVPSRVGTKTLPSGLQQVAPLLVGQGELILRGDGDEVLRLDDATGSISPVKLSGVVPVAWDRSRKLVLAYRESDQHWVLATIDGTVSEAGLEGTIASGPVFVGGASDLVFSRAKMFEKWETVLRSIDGAERSLGSELLATSVWVDD